MTGLSRLLPRTKGEPSDTFMSGVAAAPFLPPQSEFVLINRPANRTEARVARYLADVRRQVAWQEQLLARTHASSFEFGSHLFENPLMALKQRYGRIAEIEQLPYGWHEGTSPSIGSGAIDKARSVVTQLAFDSLPTPSIFPTPEGGISLEWSTDRLKAEVVLAPTGDTAEFSDWHPMSSEHNYQEEVTASVEAVCDWIAELIAAE